jgi:hypothetical protein
MRVKTPRVGGKGRMPAALKKAAQAGITEAARKKAALTGRERHGVEFRSMWREWLLSDVVVAHIKRLALSWPEVGNQAGPQVLGKLIDKVFPTPAPQSLEGEEKPPVRFVVGININEFGYKPMGRVPGMTVEALPGNGDGR